MVTEMEADLNRAKVEADAQIKIAKIKADAEVAIAKQARKKAFWSDIYMNGVIAGVLFALVILGIVGGVIGKAMQENGLKAQQIERCEASGGVWTPKVQRIYPGSGNERDEWYEVCAK